jgi:hypothetical protein
MIARAKIGLGQREFQTRFSNELFDVLHERGFQFEPSTRAANSSLPRMRRSLALHSLRGEGEPFCRALVLRSQISDAFFELSRFPGPAPVATRSLAQILFPEPRGRLNLLDHIHEYAGGVPSHETALPPLLVS